MQLNNNYNPDVLTCLANLSNDEVFTPPQVVNQMLDMLPAELFRSSKTTFLDPVSKSGVFLREIAKRLMIGLADEIPDVHERANHIFTKQLFGIAITELTSLISRRSLYCSKSANGRYSLCTEFKDEQGNLRFRSMEHTFVGGKCKYCGAAENVFGKKVRGNLESHAYEFIHNLKNFKDMKFDVIIGNPPYQLSCATENSTSNNAAFASAIYPLFIEKARKLNPRYLLMITPSRWMTKTGQGISTEWVDELINCNHFVEIHDFLDSTECFAGVDIMGGVSYFLYQGDYNGKCRFVSHNKGNERISEDYLDPFSSGVVIRDITSRDILRKIINVEGKFYNSNTFASIVSPLHFYDKSGILSSNWTGYRHNPDSTNNIKVYVNKRLEESGLGWICIDDVPKNKETIDYHKVFIPEANGSSGENAPILGTPFYGEPGSVCSQTYLVIGYNQTKQKLTKEDCMNIISYIKTRFFRYMVSIKKKTQHAPNSVYQFVPLQDFSHPWTDEMLYEKYGLSDDEIAFIESMIRPME